MQVVIDIDEEEYINIKNAINSLIENGVERASMSKVCLAILDGVQLPKEATNGDVIKAMFPNGKEYDDDGDIRYEIEIDFDYSFCSYFDGVWWNAPYKRESEGTDAGSN